ncbi:hypothetical protein FQN54_005601 [Arachnomyces sp. PD_36]|nr:hypothetical protein FQN54_005601 [Arachnomyces sp. PD_36]
MDWTTVAVALFMGPLDIPPIHAHAALNGRPGYVDSLLFCLDMKSRLKPSTLSEGDTPACAAMSTGHTFRVENQATVMYLKKMQRPGHLVTLEVGPGPQRRGHGGVMYVPMVALLIPFLFGRASRVIDIYLIATLLILFISRLLSIASLRARIAPSWRGTTDPDLRGDLLVRLSEDSYIRLTGSPEDLSAVTQGSWLSRRPENPTLVQAIDFVSQILVFVAIPMFAQINNEARLELARSMIMGHGTLLLNNYLNKQLVMNQRTVKMSEKLGSVKKYDGQREMAQDLIKETGRSDFALNLDMISPEQIGLGVGGPGE